MAFSSTPHSPRPWFGVALLLMILMNHSIASSAPLIRRNSPEAAEESPSSSCPCQEAGILPRPDMMRKALSARWMVHTLDWGIVSTISSRTAVSASTTPVPFGNVYSFVDGACGSTNSTGIPYFYGTLMDQTVRDMRHNPAASFTLSEDSLASVCGIADPLKACSINGQSTTTNNNNNNELPGDPESPVCARLTLTGTLVELEATSLEFKVAQAALWQRHPQMQYWPANHDWIVFKLKLTDIWLIDYFGGATILDVEDYLSQDLEQLFDQDDNE